MKSIYHFLITTIGILMLGSLPYLFSDEIYQLQSTLKLLQTGALKDASFLSHDIGFHPVNYLVHMFGTIKDLLNLNGINYYFEGMFLPLFPEFFYKYLYSMAIFSGALFVGILLAVLITFIIMLIPTKYKKPVNFLLLLLESLPDLFVILLLQTTISWLYGKTDILLFETLSSYQEPAYLLPILCLATLPAIFLIKHLVQLFEDELSKEYVEFAKGKGLQKSFILLVHISRNTFLILFYQFRTIYWFALSNLLMLEIIFNMKGFMQFMWAYAPTTPIILTIGLLMVFLPFYLFFTFGKVALIKGGLVKHGMENL
ncbi:ABC transporter permease subunit [Virgibacillus kekensis]|uniref:ABC transporter permease subunit n=1 Tax=Virgibacillus kekensis TaxID=202261 RepID=A0ABV9DFN9_9BACI